jgi:adenylate cyclase
MEEKGVTAQVRQKNGRRLAAIMFTDMVGFTALSQSNEAQALDVLERQNRLLRSFFPRFGGKEIKSIGDSFLVEFESALDATNCAIEIQKFLHDYNISTIDDWKIKLRIGIHLGDVIRKGNDILGDAVNIASRIEPLAPPEGVCISEQVYDQIHNKIDYPLESIENKTGLKNVSFQTKVYSVLLPWGEKGWGPSFSTRKSSREFDRLRVVVLPFSNLSPDPNDEYLADGITDELISTISRIQDIQVIARTTSMKYRATTKGAGEIGAELRAGSIMEGTVRKIGNKLRVTAQLVDPATETEIWSESYDHELRDILSIQTDIALHVAGALQVQLLSEDKQKGKVMSEGKAEAYTLTLRGRYFWNRGTLDDFKKALEQFELAIKKDPGLAEAYSGLADTHLLMARTGYVSPKFAYPKAIQHAEQALALNPRLPEPRVALAAIRQEYEWKWEESGRQFLRALELNPSYATAHGWYALYLGHLGRFDEAIEQVKRAQELDPLSPRIHCNASEEYLFARKYDNAIEAADRALKLNPSFGGAYGYRAYAYVEKGMFEEAISDFQKAGEFLGGRAVMGRLGHAYAVSGKIGEATKILDDLMHESRQPPPRIPFMPPPPDTAFDIGLVYLGLGEKKQAIDWLEKARDERTAEIIHSKCEPIYDPIQGEERFKALIASIGLS